MTAKGGKNERIPCLCAAKVIRVVLLLSFLSATSSFSGACSSSCCFVVLAPTTAPTSSAGWPPQLRKGIGGRQGQVRPSTSPRNLDFSACPALPSPVLLMCKPQDQNGSRQGEEIVEVTATGDGRLSHLVRRSLGCGMDEAEALCNLGSVWVRKNSYGRLLSWARRVEDGHVKQGSIVKVYKNPRRFKASNVDWRERVLLEDGEFIVLDKPSGLPTHATTSNFRECLVSSASAALGIKLLGLHRLDMMVSGCIALAKTKAAASLFHSSNRPASCKLEVGASGRRNAAVSHHKMYLSLSTHRVREGLHTHWMLPSGSHIAAAFLDRLGHSVDDVGQLSILSEVGGEGLKECSIQVVRCTEVMVDRGLLSQSEPRRDTACNDAVSIEYAESGSFDCDDEAEAQVPSGRGVHDGGDGAVGATSRPWIDPIPWEGEEENGQNVMYESEIVLLSGRRHQIRCQMSALGAPLWGDTLYAPLAGMTVGRDGVAGEEGGERGLAGSVVARCLPPSERIGLHCASLGFMGRNATSREPWWRPAGRGQGVAATGKP